MPVTKLCVNCGGEYQCRPSHAAKKTYCSKACMGEHYKVRLSGDDNPNAKPQNTYLYTCATCGKEFKSYAKSPKYCSRSCKAKDIPIEELRRRGALCKGKVHLSRRKDVKTRNLVCKGCGATFQWPEKRTYCDSCQHLSPKSRDISRPCVVCGNRFRPARSSPRYKKTCSKECLSTWRAAIQEGERSRLWQGGKTSKAMSVRNSAIYAIWRNEVFSRDGFVCQMCHKTGCKLAAHHIVPFSESEELRLDVTNGIALCWSCHRGIKGREAEYQDMFNAYTRHLQFNHAAPVYIVNNVDDALLAIGTL